MTPVIADDLPTPGESSAQSPVSAPPLNSEALRGTWHIDMKVGGVSVKGSTEYNADGTFQGAATYILDDEKTELTMKGTWKLESQTLITTITQSSNPELEFDGRKVRSQGFYVAVRKKTAKEWKLLDEAGFRNNPEMLWPLLPDLPRGVAVPAVKREVIDE